MSALLLLAIIVGSVAAYTEYYERTKSRKVRS